MCLGIPMQVLEGGSMEASCRDGDLVTRVDLSLVGPQPEGTWVLVSLGSAREVVDERRAREVRAALQALQAVMRGETVDLAAHFADLIGREPQLPPHLQPTDNETTREPEP